MTLLAKNTGGKNRPKGSVSGVPQHEIDAFVRLLLPRIQQLYESEEGQKEFAEWKKQQAEKEK